LERKDVWGPSTPLQTPDDEKILQYAVELFRQLGITKPELDAITWDVTIGPDVVVVKYGEVRLSQRMMGRLAAEDWKPLLLPALIYNYLLLRDESRDALLYMLLPLVPTPFLVTLSLIVLIRSIVRGPLFETLLTTIVSLQVIYSALVIVLFTRRRWRSLLYTADQRAASIIGKEALLAALAKYGERISATGYPRKRLHLWPTIGQRIERLQK
jgi:hypothetical protein